jgi:lysophospholipase L1-like esterase
MVGMNDLMEELKAYAKKGDVSLMEKKVLEIYEATGGNGNVLDENMVRGYMELGYMEGIAAQSVQCNKAEQDPIFYELDMLQDYTDTIVSYNRKFRALQDYSPQDVASGKLSSRKT